MEIDLKHEAQQYISSQHYWVDSPKEVRKGSPSPTFMLEVARAISEASDSLIDECLNLPDCQGWFLEWSLLLRSHCSDAQLELIVLHPNSDKHFIQQLAFMMPLWFQQLESKGRMTERVKALCGAELVDLRLQHSDDTRQIAAIILLSESLYSGLLSLRWTLRTWYPGSTVEERRFLIASVPPLFAEFALNWACATGKKVDIDAITDFIPQLSKQQLTLLTNSEARQARVRAASDKQCPLELLIQLSQDKSKPVREAALRQLPLEYHPKTKPARKSPGKKNTSSKNTSTQDTDIQETSFINSLLSDALSSDDLINVVRNGDALSVCTATLHNNANAEIITIAETRQLPEWAQLGIARHTRNAERINQQMNSRDEHVLIALAANPNLTPEQALGMIGPNNWVNAQIGNQFIDNNDILDRIAKQGDWKQDLPVLRDHSTTVKSLQETFRKRTLGYALIDRLMARNPKCPKTFYRKLVYYVPDDLQQNPVYALHLLESGKAVSPSSYNLANVVKEVYRGDSEGLEVIFDDMMTSETDAKLVRDALTAPSLNPNHVNQIAITADRYLHRALLDNKCPCHSEFVYRIIAAVGSVTLRKALVNHPQQPASDELILLLTDDKDSSIRQSAAIEAARRGLIKSFTPDKTSLKSLGNKAARIDLAKNSNDLEILQMLCNDKLPAVRREVARRREQILPLQNLLQLTTDSDEYVQRSAIYTLNEDINNDSGELHQQFQSELTALLQDEQRPAELRALALAHCEDGQLVDQYWQHESIRAEFLTDTGSLLLSPHSHSSLMRHYLDAEPFDGEKFKACYRLKSLTFEQIDMTLSRYPKVANEMYEELRHNYSLRKESHRAEEVLTFLIANYQSYIHPQAAPEWAKDRKEKLTKAIAAYPDLEPFRAFVERIPNHKNVMLSILAQAEELAVSC
ncbi:hypothetical protein [Oceanobacter mangrovi]|uniref:hypothetical protein n=1 Tax=Oceanobacter mangrovi TaxID=2862510 RepID=UPI001C8DCD32|nr:hypothetical protein [Oceanobacter mangrovi]